MKKRAGLARALIMDPEIVLFDEPTTGLDPLLATEHSSIHIRKMHQDFRLHRGYRQPRHSAGLRYFRSHRHACRRRRSKRSARRNISSRSKIRWCSNLFKAETEGPIEVL